MKNLLLNASLLLLASNLVAQLHVKPNPVTNSDSYIYANDVVLYVEEGIDLNVNNNVETKASIYLRGNAQLIQGEKPNSLNSGNGHLSIWQRGYANAFDYNYWASPIGNPNASPATGNTNFGIPRIFDVRDAGGNTLHPTRSTQQSTTSSYEGVYSDVSAGVDGTLRISSRWIYKLIATNQYSQWIFIGNQNGNGNGLAPGEGFSMKGTGLPAQVENAHNQLYDFRGRPNDGTISITVGHNGTSSLSTLTGNPYPSSLDLAAFLNHPSNVNEIEGEIRFWDQDRTTNTHYIYDYQGGYGVWVPEGGDPVPDEYGGGTSGIYAAAPFKTYDGYGSQNGTTGTTGSVYTGRFAPPAQGFVVMGSSTTTGTAVIDNSMRRYVPYGALYNNEFKNIVGSASFTGSVGSTPIIPETPEYVYPTLRFHVEINETYIRDMVMTFSPETTKGKDRGWDGRHSGIVNEGDAYWLLENETSKYVIQARPFDEYDAIPLGIKKKNGNTTFIIKVAEAHNFSNNMYLYDIQNNQYQRLDTENKAQINLNGPAGNIDNRYFIVFRRDIQDQNIPQRISEMNISFFQNNKLSQLEVFNPETIDIKTASVYDMSGKLVIHEKNLGMRNSYTFSTQNLSSGIYLVKLITADDIIVDYKVTVHNK